MKNKQFRDVYLNLPRANNEHITIRKDIEKYCNISTSVFYNWSSGITEVPHWAKPIISKILNIPQSELFPTQIKEITN